MGDMAHRVRQGTLDVFLSRFPRPMMRFAVDGLRRLAGASKPRRRVFASWFRRFRALNLDLSFLLLTKRATFRWRPSVAPLAHF
jgi:hypothetical protein